APPRPAPSPLSLPDALPISTYAPCATVVPGPSEAGSSTTAVAATAGGAPAAWAPVRRTAAAISGRVDEREGRLGGDLVADQCPGLDLAQAAAERDDAPGQPEHVAGDHLAPEAGALDAGEVADARGSAALARGQRDAGCLRQRLDDQHAGHHGLLREVAGEERLVVRDVLDALELVAAQGDEPVHEEERVAVRQHRPDVDVHGGKSS